MSGRTARATVNGCALPVLAPAPSPKGSPLLAIPVVIQFRPKKQSSKKEVELLFSFLFSCSHLQSTNHQTIGCTWELVLVRCMWKKRVGVKKMRKLRKLHCWTLWFQLICLECWSFFSSSLMMIELNTATSYFGSTSFTLYFICLHASFVSCSLSSSLFFHI